MKVAILSPIAYASIWSVGACCFQYRRRLADKGIDVTLFATGDSIRALIILIPGFARLLITKKWFMPVIAILRGSMPELILQGKTGFFVNNLDEAEDAVIQLGTINRNACRQWAASMF